ncbi:hypothetical protein L3Q82_025525 [Scortum barcoo]|uniref:Uncharacterized protein n=1 Tax=Scortum barcoo TaxID=214431 RepID=A0ACB8WKL9_9TELE|nr:hypothetical protein L3Q82_025525 [Scortum barcoo]
MSADLEEQEDEQLALLSILGPEEFVRKEPKRAGEIRVCAELPAGFTVSLKEGDTLRQYEMSFLPPLHLTFELPEDYPSSSPPSFTLSCSWLTHTQLSALSAQLTDLYWATGGSVVLFTWVHFLKEEALRFLDVHALLELPSDERGAQYHEQDSLNAALSHPKNAQHTLESGLTDDQSCSASDPHDLSAPSLEAERPAPIRLTASQALLSQLLIHDAAQKQRAFATTVFDCGVCALWASSVSSVCGCPTVATSSAGLVLAQLCKLQITEGNVQGVTCPETDCPASPTPAQVRSLVGEELFSRYDRLLLQNTLDCMPDVTYCPRRSCGSAVILEKFSNAAMCSVCSFAFCVACKKTYHGAEDCQRREIVRRQAEHGGVDLPQSQEGMKALWDDYSSGSMQRKRLLESRYGRQALQVTMEAILSEDWIMLNIKYCPHCFCRIQKNGGCNMMTCSQCWRQFCWACLAILTSMSAGKHFEEGTCTR